MPAPARRRAARTLAVLGGAVTVALALSACAAATKTASAPTSASGKAITVGTTDRVAALDPAGEFDAGSAGVTEELYANLLAAPAGSTDLKPDLAQSVGFSGPTTYKVTLKPSLKFANGDALTSSDVKFTFDRQLKIADPNGPSSLLYNLASVEAPDATTVLFHLKTANDQVFPQVLASPAGQIVDEQVFSADAITPDAAIVKANASSGPYTLSSYKANQLAVFSANPHYSGIYGTPKTKTINLQYFADDSNLKLELQQKDIDVAWRTLTTTDVDSLKSDKDVKVYNGAPTGIRFLTFNFASQPYGTKTPNADPKKALAVRQAAADLIDRQALSTQVYKGTFTPLYAYAPTSISGSYDALKSVYGDGNGGPSADKAKQALQAAGVTTPVKLTIQYNTDHYGTSSADEYALIKNQLEAGGLFNVTINSTEWVQYKKDFSSGTYPIYQLGWYDDYLDVQDFFQPIFGAQGFIQNGYDDKAVDAEIQAQVTTNDPATRKKLAQDIQEKLAASLPTIPLLQGGAVVVAGADIKGVQPALDSGNFPLAVLSK